MKTTHKRPAIIPPLLLIAAACLFLGQSLFAAVTLPFYDEFPSSLTPDGGQLLTLDANWISTASSGSATNIVLSTNYAQSYTGLLAPGAGSLGAHYINIAGNRMAGVQIPTTSSGSVYASFLLRVTTGTTGSRVIFEMNTSSAGSVSSPPFGIALNSDETLSLYKYGLLTNKTEVLNFNQTYLVVARYNFVDPIGTVGGTNDTVDLWLNPSSLGGTAPTPTIAGPASTFTNAFSGLRTANWGLQTGTAGEFDFDEVRVGTSWADVTPPALVAAGSYFSSITSGNWNATNTWEYSPDGSTIINPATTTPTIDYAVTNNVSHVVAITNAAGALSLDVLGTVTVSGAGSLTVSNALRLATGGTLDLTTKAATVGPVTMTGGNINGAGGSLTATSYTVPVGAANVSVSANLTGTGALTLSEPTATLALSGTNTYSGDTTIGNGTVQANGAPSLSGGSLLKTGNSTANNAALNLAVASAGYTLRQLSLGGAINFSGPVSGSATLTFTNGAVVTGTPGKKLNVLDPNTAIVVDGPLFDLIGTSGTANRILTITNNGTFIINAPMQDLSPTTPSGGLTLYGEGTTVLSGTNTYAGTNKIYTGTLRVNGPSALSAVTTLATGPSTLNSTTLDLGASGSYSVSSLLLSGIMRVTALGGAASLTFTGPCVMSGSGSRALDAGNNVTININDTFDLFGGTSSTNRNLNTQGDGDFVINAPLTNTATSGNYVVGLRKTGLGTTTLNTAMYYNGGTIINEGTVAIGASGTINLSTNISIGADATFDVSAASFSLTAAYQVLGNNLNNTNSSNPGLIKGNLNAGSGTIDLTLTNGTLCLTVTNGALTLSGSTLFTITNAAPTLTAGSYKLISKSTGGSVAGTVASAVAVGGNGAADTTTLAIRDGELWLDVGSVSPLAIPLTVSQAGNVLTFSWTNAAFHLQSQTNTLAVGLNTNWVNYPGSSPVSVTNNPANPAVFFRLITP